MVFCPKCSFEVPTHRLRRWVQCKRCRHSFGTNYTDTLRISLVIGIASELLLLTILWLFAGNGILLLWSLIGGLLAFFIYAVTMHRLCRAS